MSRLRDEINALDRATRAVRRGTHRRHHIAAYAGKLVEMSYIPKPKDEYKFAAMRIVDNNHDGYVITPLNEVFEIRRSKRMGRRLPGEEAATVLAGLGLTS